MVQQAILRLPYPYRIVLVMRDLEQLSTNEVSEILGISRDSVKIRLHRARSVLRKDLQSHFVASNRKTTPKSSVKISTDVRAKLRKSFVLHSQKKHTS